MSDYQHWYYINKNYEEDGPVSSDELTRMVSSGELSKGTYVWTQELDEWVPASKVGGLFAEQKPLNEPAALSQPPAQITQPTPNTKAKPQLKQLAAHTRTGYLGRNKTGYLASGANPTTASALIPTAGQRQPDRPIGRTPSQADSLPPQNPITAKVPTASSPSPFSAPPLNVQTTQKSTPNPAPSPKPTNQKLTTSHNPVPLSAPIDLVPKPITTAHNIPSNLPGSLPTIPAAGANSIPVPSTPSPTPAGNSGLPPAPTPPGSTPPAIAGLPQIPPVGRSIAPFNQTPTSALIEADDKNPPEKKGPRPMSMD